MVASGGVCHVGVAGVNSVQVVLGPACEQLELVPTSNEGATLAYLANGQSYEINVKHREGSLWVEQWIPKSSPPDLALILLPTGGVSFLDTQAPQVHFLHWARECGGVLVEVRAWLHHSPKRAGFECIEVFYDGSSRRPDRSVSFIAGLDKDWTFEEAAPDWSHGGAVRGGELLFQSSLLPGEPDTVQFIECRQWSLGVPDSHGVWSPGDSPPPLKWSRRPF